MKEIPHQTKFYLYDNGTVKVSVPTNKETKKIRKLIRVNDGKKLDNLGNWQIPFKSYKPLLKQLKVHKIQYDKLPIFIYQLLKRSPIIDSNQKRQQKIRDQEIRNELHKLDYFQRDAVIKSNRFYGRILVADDLGVGKTLTALSIADQYKDLWPLLIICHQLLRLKWQDQIKEWLGIKQDDIKIITEKKDKIYNDKKVIIISYDICKKKEELLQREFKVGIADECYYLKEQSERSQVCVPILQNCKHVILISGTPLQGKPRDLFNILKIVKKDQFSNKKSLKEFRIRYCDPKYNYIQKKINFNGSSNLEELHYLMKNYIMTRANYDNTSCNIPNKEELYEYVECNKEIVKDIQSRNFRITTRLDEVEYDDQDQDQANNFDLNNKNVSPKTKQVLKDWRECYQLTGRAKISGILQALSEIIKNSDSSQKIIFFALHLEVLEEVKAFCKNNNHQFVTMFGEKDAKQTIQEHVLQKHRTAKEFQEKTSVKIAILSILQASVGLDLTAASIVVFGELYWNNGVMQSAIARCHRRGQRNNVKCYYLIAKGTLDDRMLKILKYKKRVEQMILDNPNPQGGQDDDIQYQEEANLDSENEFSTQNQEEIDQEEPNQEQLKEQIFLIESIQQENHLSKKEQKLLKLQGKQSTKKDNQTQLALNIKGDEDQNTGIRKKNKQEQFTS